MERNRTRKALKVKQSWAREERERKWTNANGTSKETEFGKNAKITFGTLEILVGETDACHQHQFVLQKKK